MKTTRFYVNACCGKMSVAIKIDRTISMEFLALLISKGFVEAKHFTKSGILYAENNAIIVNGSFGSDILNIKCKVSQCDHFIDNFETLLMNTG